MTTTRVAPPSIMVSTVTHGDRPFFKWLIITGLAILVAVPFIWGVVWLFTPSEGSSKPATTAAVQKVQCPGIAPKAPTTVTSAWTDINPHGCDLTYYVTKGTVKFAGPGGSDNVSGNTNVTGRRNFLVLTRVKAESGSAEILYMLCPQGKGPTDGSWSCKK